ncbi:hypothetical protein GCM10020000_03790 [Streptomyces olivoverticillatus]
MLLGFRAAIDFLGTATTRPASQEPRLNEFEGIAHYCVAYQSGVPQVVVPLLTNKVCGVASPTLLDLGSGTGEVPMVLHKAFAEIDVVGADAWLIAEADAAFASPDRPGPAVRFHRVRAEDFTPPAPVEGRTRHGLPSLPTGSVPMAQGR